MLLCVLYLKIKDLRYVIRLSHHSHALILVYDVLHTYVLLKKDLYRDVDRNMLTSKDVGNLGMADISVITQVCLLCQLCFR